MKTQSCMNRLLWITLLVIGLSGCSEESSSSEENTESGTIQDGDHTDNATVIQLNSSDQYQTVEGIGGGIANYENWYCQHPNKKELFDLIFKDLEISMIRIGNWYEKKISGENPDILKQQKEIMDAATQRLGRSNFSVMMSNWLVAPDLIDRPKEKGATLKRNNEGKYMYKEFGEWCRMTLKAYQEADMSPDYLSMMNEPDGDNSAGTKIRLGYGIDDSQKANYGKALDATYEAFKEVSKRPKLIGPEVLGIGYGTFSNYYRDLNPDLLDAAAFHCYHGGKTSDYKDNDRYSSAHAFKTEFQNIVRQVGNKSIMMTENCSYHPAVPEDAVNIAHFISNSFRYANATVYLHWAPCRCRLTFLFCIVEGYVTTFGSAYPDSVFDRNDEDTSVTDFSGLCSFDDSLHCFLGIFVAYDNRDQNSFNGAGVIYYATVDTSLPCFSNTSYIVIREPFDVRFE